MKAIFRRDHSTSIIKIYEKPHFTPSSRKKKFIYRNEKKTSTDYFLKCCDVFDEFDRALKGGGGTAAV